MNLPMCSFPYKTNQQNPKQQRPVRKEEEFLVSFEVMLWVLGGPGQPMQTYLLCKNRHRPCPLQQRGKERPGSKA